MPQEYEIDLEHFPTSEAAKRMLSRVSPIYERSYVGKWIFQVIGMEWDEAKTLIESLREQCYLESVSWGIRYWEERYGIEPDESIDLEVRRARIKRAGRRYGAISPAKLEDILAEFTGLTVHITEDNPHYSFDVQFEDGDTIPDYTAIVEKLNSTKPSHLSYRFLLPRRCDHTLYFANIIHIRRTEVYDNCPESGVSGLVWLVDENGDTLLDENGNVLLDPEM